VPLALKSPGLGFETHSIPVVHYCSTVYKVEGSFICGLPCLTIKLWTALSRNLSHIEVSVRLAPPHATSLPPRIHTPLAALSHRLTAALTRSPPPSSMTEMPPLLSHLDSPSIPNSVLSPPPMTATRPSVVLGHRRPSPTQTNPMG
jgi:hypothetical protein